MLDSRIFVDIEKFFGNKVGYSWWLAKKSKMSYHIKHRLL